MKIVSRLIEYFRHEIWKTRARDYPRPRSFFIRHLKIIILALRGFFEDRAGVRASALTLYTLLSIVPVLALLFGIAKGFGLDARLEQWLLNQLPEQEELLGQAIVFANRLLESTQGGLVAGAGVVFLLYTVVRLITNIEQAFNHIWSIAKARSWGRKFSDYLSLMLVGPFLALGASSLNVYVATVVGRFAEAAPLSELVNPVVRMALGLGPILLLWILFSFTYVFLPNTKVRILSGVYGGGIAAVLYQILQTLYINLQVGVSKANAIYGSFAALPLFLIWLQISWHIVLLGAELAHLHQNFESNEKEERAPLLSFRAIQRLGLCVTYYVTRRFLRGEEPPTAEKMAGEMGIPTRLLGDVVRRLTESHILSETATSDPTEAAYQPARDPHVLTPSDILEALESHGEDLEGAEGEAAWERFAPLLEEFDRCQREHPQNRPLSVSAA